MYASGGLLVCIIFILWKIFGELMEINKKLKQHGIGG